jgi:L,D-transpeptidase catalytic domain
LRRRKGPAKRNDVRLVNDARLVQEQVLCHTELGYWAGPVDGTFDSASRQALIAFQKVERRSFTPDELEALRAAKPPVPLESGYFHVEVDIRRQVLFVIEADGMVSKILPVSSGSGKLFTSEGWTCRAVTPTERFRVSHKIAGWRKSPLGLLYYPVYFLSGIAIHGNPSVPMVPARHGCVRIPMFAAKQFSDIVPVGTTVLVHDGSAIKPGADTS